MNYACKDLDETVIGYMKALGENPKRLAETLRRLAEPFPQEGDG